MPRDAPAREAPLPPDAAAGYIRAMALALALARGTDRDRTLGLGLAVLAFAALGVALASEHWGGLAPCKLCLYQRWPLLGAGLAGLLAAILPAPALRPLLALAALGFLTSAGIAGYHAGVEQGLWTGPTTCSTPGGTPDDLAALRQQIMGTALVRCDEVPWSLFGISIAGYNLLFSGTIGALALLALRRRPAP